MVISALGFLEDLTFKAQPTDVDWASSLCKRHASSKSEWADIWLIPLKSESA
jgi:hypothetical protein